MSLPSVLQCDGWNIRYRYSLPLQTLKPKAPPRTVVFVHGTPWSSKVFEPIIEALLAKRPFYGCLVYDLPGYGQSQDLNTSYESTASEQQFAGDTSVKFQAKALKKLLGHLGIDGREGRPKPDVIAHDIAGAIVLRAHLVDGIEYNSMLLMDTNAVLPWGDGFYKLVRSEPQTFLSLPPNTHEAVVRATIRSACCHEKVLQNGWEDLLAEPWLDRTPSPMWVGSPRQTSFVRQIAQANDEDIAEMLRENMYERVQCNIKILWGEQDQWIPKEKIEQLVSRFGAKVKEVVYVPRAGHLVMLDQPERVAVEIFDWLS